MSVSHVLRLNSTKIQICGPPPPIKFLWLAAWLFVPFCCLCTCPVFSYPLQKLNRVLCWSDQVTSRSTEVRESLVPIMPLIIRATQTGLISKPWLRHQTIGGCQFICFLNRRFVFTSCKDNVTVSLLVEAVSSL